MFTYTDHYLPPTREARPRGRHNIRLKYAQDPSENNEVKILEEDHYYPGACPERSRRGLKHTGYNSKHLVFGTTPGGAIALSEESPLLKDSYRYKFGGMEYQDEFDINSYDFGARNYDPALGRWMNLDPMAELMRRHSPYNYAFNNPVYFIDPDGMMSLPFGGGGTGSFDSIGGSGKKSGGSNGSEMGFDERISTSNGETNSSEAKPKSDTQINDGRQVIAIQYIDERGEEIINTDDGSDDIITIPDERLAEFIKNIYWTSDKQLNSQGWNIYWKAEILGFDNSTSMENLLSSAASQESRQRMINYLQSGDISDGLKFVLTEVIYQNLNPLNHLPDPINTRPANPWIKFNRQMGPGKFTKHNYGSSKAANKARKGAYSKWKKENSGYY